MVVTIVTSEINTDRRPPDPPDNKTQQQALYSDKLKTSVTWDNRLKRNVLEISLEKDDESQDVIDQGSILRLFKTLGMSPEKDVEGYYQRNRSIHVWLVNGINLDRFCMNESIKVANGIKTGFIRPSGKKEVTVTVSGLDFNTPDTFVMAYLDKFGNLANNRVIYDRYKEGPFAGKYNGDRKYQVDFTGGKIAMGTFHIIDGNRVKVFYPGNRKTCGRCHQTSDICKGEAIARECEKNGGIRVELTSHMRLLWRKVDFQPSEFNLETENSTADVHIDERRAFSPLITRPTLTEE